MAQERVETDATAATRKPAADPARVLEPRAALPEHARVTLSLQRRAGNRAVSMLVERRAQSVQRVEGERKDAAGAASTAIVPYQPPGADAAGSRRAERLVQVEERKRAEQGSALGTLIAKDPAEGGEVLTPSQHRRDVKIKEVEARKRAFEAETQGSMIASESFVLDPQASAKHRRELRLKQVDERRRAMEGDTKGTMIAGAGFVLDPEASAKHAGREGKKAAPTKAAEEQARLTRLREWEAQASHAQAKKLVELARASDVHKPPNLLALDQALDAAWSAKDYPAVVARGKAVTTLAGQVVEADTKLTEVRSRVDKLPAATEADFGAYRTNMTQWLTAYKGMSWAEQPARLKWLDERAFDYLARVVSRRAEAAAGAAETQAAKDQGRVAADGTIIARKNPADFPAEERAKIERALRRHDGTPNPGEHLWWSGKWAEYHGNNEGRLPGTRGGGGYKEYYVEPGPGQTAPGPRRLVKKDSNGRMFYSNTHYGDSGSPAYYALRGW